MLVFLVLQNALLLLLPVLLIAPQTAKTYLTPHFTKINKTSTTVPV